MKQFTAALAIMTVPCPRCSKTMHPIHVSYQPRSLNRYRCDEHGLYMLTATQARRLLRRRA